MQADSQPGQRVVRVIVWWCTDGSEKESRRHQNERSSERETRLPIHARQPQQCAPSSIDRAAKMTGFKRSTGSPPHAPRPIDMRFFYFSVYFILFFAVSNSTITDSSGCLHYLREFSLEPWVCCLQSIYSIPNIYKSIVWRLNLYRLFNRRAVKENWPLFMTYREYGHNSSFFDTQAIPLDRPLHRKKIPLKFKADVCGPK